MRLYTADLHLGHDLVAKLRGFDEAAEHDDHVLDALRRTVNPKGDVLWILGDLSGGSKAGTERALDLLAEIPGTKHGAVPDPRAHALATHARAELTPDTCRLGRLAAAGPRGRDQGDDVDPTLIVSTAVGTT